METLAGLIYRFRVWLFAAVVALAVLFAACIRFEMNNDLDAWFAEDDPVSRDYRLFGDTFEGGDSLIVGVESDRLFTRENLSYIAAKTSELGSVPRVRRVVSLANSNRVRGTAEGIDVRPLLDDIDHTPGEELKRQALQDELFSDYLVSRDGRMSALFVVFDEVPAADVAATIERVHSVMERGRPDGLDVFLSGGLMVSNEFIKATRKNQTVLPALGVLIGLSAIFALFRSLSRIVLISLVIALSLCLTLGFHTLLGQTYNPISGMIIPLIVILSLSNSIHMIEYYDELRGTKDVRSSFVAMVRYITVPCFIASVTTTLGLLSLTTSPIKAVKEFGLTSGAGIMFSFAVSVLVVPFLLTVTPAPRRVVHRYWGRALGGVSRLNDRHHYLILGASSLLAVFACAGLLRVTIDSNELDWFPRDSELRRNALKFDRALSGIGNIELVLTDGTDMLLDPGVLSRVDELSRRIERLEGVRKVISLADYVKAVNRTLNEGDQAAFRVPESHDLIAQEVLLFSMSETGREEIERFANLDWSVGRVSIRLQYASSAEVRRLVARIRSMVGELFPDGRVKVGMTGFSYIFSMIDKYIVDSQIRSFSLAFVLVFGVMFVVMWSVRYGLLAVVPNVLPILLIVGIMGWAGITLNVGTVMIASVALGIAVDDTTHFISRFRKEYDAAGVTFARALRQAMIRVGRAMVFTSVIAVCGFSVVLASEFQPARDFGILLSLTLVIALACDMFLLPSMMIVLRRWLVPGASPERGAGLDGSM